MIELQKLEEYEMYFNEKIKDLKIYKVFKKEQLQERIKWLTDEIMNINPCDSKRLYLKAIKEVFKEIMEE